MQTIRAGQVLKYALLPGIAPRMRQLFGSGFGYLAFLMATIYGMARLLPPGHPYLNPQNIGRFGAWHVVTEAFSRLRFTRKHIDQVIVFGAVLTGMVLLVLQIVLTLYFALVGAAQAQISVFDTPKPEKDIALNLLDRVFGIPNMFCNDAGACTLASTTNGGIPWPMHTALHDLFHFYSTAMLMVAVLIILYFVVVVVAETATTGSPFGQRFQNVWVPIRLVVALGLLVPINYGYSTGQYLALYSAKLGSGIATNGWLRFNQVISGRMGDDANPAGERKSSFVAQPKTPSVAPLVQTMSIIHTCAYAEWMLTADRPQYPFPESYHNSGFYLVKPYFVKNPTPNFGDQREHMEVTAGTQYTDALTFYNNADIVIRFGWHDNSARSYFSDQVGKVGPLCGEIRIPVSDVAHIGQADTMGGSDYVLRHYFNMVRDMWFMQGGQYTEALKAGAVRFSEIREQRDSGWLERACGVGDASMGLPMGARGEGCVEHPKREWQNYMIQHYQSWTEREMKRAWELFVAYRQDITMTQDILDLGWGGSAVWYNRIAEINGAFFTAVVNVPIITKYPMPMEEVKRRKQQHDNSATGVTIFDPYLPIGRTPLQVSSLMEEKTAQKAKILSDVYVAWNKDGQDDTNPERQLMQNIFRDAMSMILGLDGLLAIRSENAHVHPLAQLTMVGKAMVEHTIRNLAMSSIGVFMGGALSAMNYGQVGGLAEAIGGFFFSTAMIGLTAGILLYYVVPFLPFIYFFFAVGSWVKSIFEAMVGVPLWALAHLRLDGEGLPGESASNGYFLILEIGLRPILSVFGLIAAILIFTAQARILNFIWELVVPNATGFSNSSVAVVGTPVADEAFAFKRDVVDQFFFTIIYTIILYMLATASFKLIDRIPDNIMRWMGSGASSFGSMDQNTPESLGQYVATAGMVQGRQLTQGLQELAGGAGRIVGTALK